MLYLLIFSIIFASFNSILLHRVSLKDNRAVFTFNLICSGIWCICLWTANRFQLHVNREVLLWGTLYGVTQTLFILFKTLAMNHGPVSLTTMSGNMSLLISVIFCFAVWKEAVELSDIIGLAVLLGGIFLSTYEQTGDNKSGKWFLYLLFFLIFAAGVGISFKAFARTGYLEYAGDMMLIASLVMLLLYTFINLVLRKGETKKQKGTVSRTFLIYAVFSGVLSCAYNRLNIYLSGSMDAVIFFPAFNGGVIFLSTILSVLLLKEKMKTKAVVGTALGVAGICIIGIL